MNHPTPATPERLADLVAALEAMREAGWIDTTPEPTPVQGTGPTGPNGGYR